MLHWRVKPFIIFLVHNIARLIDMFEKKSREGSAEPTSSTRPAEPYNPSDEEEEGDESHEESDIEKPFDKNEDDDDDDDDEIV